MAEAATYRLAGLRIISDLPLFGIQPCGGEFAFQDEIRIRLALVPSKLCSAAATFRDSQHVGGNDGKEVFLDFPQVARFLVRGGKEILIEPAAASDPGEVRAYLLGTVFGILCHQRGIIPLHASAIDVEDCCVAFVGASGAGKSTLVAALARRGYETIADDVCFLQTDEKKVIRVRPGIGRIRLWADAIHTLGYERIGVEQEMHGYNKFFVPVRPPPRPFDYRRLWRIYELHAAADENIGVIPLRGVTAVEVLMQNVYRLGIAERLGFKPRAFSVCVAAARNIPVFRLSRPKHFQALARTIEILEAHMLK